CIAVSGLRRMSGRIERRGPQRRINSRYEGGDGMILIFDKDEISQYVHEPKVDGLMPYLIKAAGDSSEDVRIGALYALADTVETEAADRIRESLKDESSRVRFYAACFLTEYDEACGLDQLKANLKRLRNTEPDKNYKDRLDDHYSYYDDIGRLLASFERITRMNMGTVPMNPHLMSDLRKWPEVKKRYKTLLDTWSVWWEAAENTVAKYPL
ncbi:MAG: HEAT repeat domain-containing protein, partial [Anaerohalosphaera sp.]|nr:HEAT repeat domain-containing protein [Anaerohalosphaera sp.]